MLIACCFRKENLEKLFNYFGSDNPIYKYNTKKSYGSLKRATKN